MLGDSGRRPSAVARALGPTARRAKTAQPPSSPSLPPTVFTPVSRGVLARPVVVVVKGNTPMGTLVLFPVVVVVRRPGAPAVWVGIVSRSTRAAPGFAAAQLCAVIDRIAGATTAGSRRLVAPVSSARREAPFGGVAAAAGAGGGEMFGDASPLLHPASSACASVSARPRSHDAVARIGVSVHASSAGVYISTESRSLRRIPCLAFGPRGPSRAAQHRIELGY